MSSASSANGAAKARASPAFQAAVRSLAMAAGSIMGACVEPLELGANRQLVSIEGVGQRERVAVPIRFNGSHTKQQLLERNALRLAIVLRGIYEETGGSDTRLLTGLLMPDELVEVGRSIAGADHREHVIPRKVIWTECKRLFDVGAPDEEVARFLIGHIKVVRISREEQLHLDSASGANLKQSMPKGWKVGDDVFARLSAANIKFTPM